MNCPQRCERSLLFEHDPERSYLKPIDDALIASVFLRLDLPQRIRSGEAIGHDAWFEFGRAVSVITRTLAAFDEAQGRSAMIDFVAAAAGNRLHG